MLAASLMANMRFLDRPVGFRYLRKGVTQGVRLTEEPDAYFH